MSKKITKEEFIEFSNIIHKNKYDYSNVVYVNRTTKINIICPIHGEFMQMPHAHLDGSGCQRCANTSNNKTNEVRFNNFLEKANNVHNNKYDYSKANYVDINTKIIIICPTHGEFSKQPNNHLNGQGCPKCNNLKDTLNDFIFKANKKHNNKYDYSLVEYFGTLIPISIICPEHGIFKQKPNSHLCGSGCPKCIGRHKTTEDFINQANIVHNYKYNYEKTVYVNVQTKVKIICPMHGEFEQNVNTHLDGHGCKSCRDSRGEKKIKEILRKKNEKYIFQKKFESCKHKSLLSFDFYLPDKNLLIEYNGIQHYVAQDYFGGNEKLISQQKNDEIKRNFAIKNNINLLIIAYYENIEDKLNELI
jgi:hypothetical protein